ncbi:MAG TPA: hypothetical protein VG498_16970 [Terriglobales bacterium]|nr:hypothetical protein [Terriglobales bacterium]
MAENELAAAKNDHSLWMYRDRNSSKDTVKVEEVIETPEGSMQRLLSVNGKRPSPEQEKQSEEAIKKFLTDSNYRKQQREKSEQDAKKATDLLAMLPKAFIYSSAGKQGDLIRLQFRPQPNFHPPTREAKVFHAMQGVLLIDSKQMRLAKLSGHLVDSVDFGGGILGKLKKGGSFEVDQADMGGGHWNITKLAVHISGHALFFATIREQQDESMSNFRAVPPGTTVAKAADLLKDTSDVATARSNGIRHR